MELLWLPSFSELSQEQQSDQSPWLQTYVNVCWCGRVRDTKHSFALSVSSVEEQTAILIL